VRFRTLRGARLTIISKELLSDELWRIVEPLLPTELSKARGGKSRIPNRAVLSGIIFVLKSGIPWRTRPKELSFGSGVTCWRWLWDWQKACAVPYFSRFEFRTGCAKFSAEDVLVQKGGFCFRADFGARSQLACDLGFERALTLIHVISKCNAPLSFGSRPRWERSRRSSWRWSSD
jgi:transposase